MSVSRTLSCTCETEAMWSSSSSTYILTSWHATTKEKRQRTSRWTRDSPPNKTLTFLCHVHEGILWKQRIFQNKWQQEGLQFIDISRYSQARVNEYIYTLTVKIRTAHAQFQSQTKKSKALMKYVYIYICQWDPFIPGVANA